MPQQKTGLVPGILVGFAAMLIGAAAYGAIIGISGYEIGFAAIGVGALVGVGMMAVKPTSPVLPPLAALFGLAGAALGQIIGTTWLLVAETSAGYGEAVSAVVSSFGDILGEDPKSLLFWAIGAFAGYSFVSKRVRAANEASPSFEAYPAAVPVAEQGDPAFGAPAPTAPAPAVEQDAPKNPAQG